MPKEKGGNNLISEIPESLPEELVGHFELVKFTRSKGKPAKSELGKGTFGVVKLIRNRQSREFFACKIMDKTALLQMKQLAAIYREVDCMREQEHPHILHFYGAFENQRYLYLQLELAKNGNLLDFQKRFPKLCLPEPLAGYFVGQICKGCAYLHTNKYVHRDLKNQNVLMDDNYGIKICDFGATARLSGRLSKRNTFTGTPEFMAPELFLEKGHGFGYDIWSVGCVTAFLLAGAPPFYGTNFERTPAMVRNIRACKFVLPPHLSKSASHLITSILKSNPDERPTAQGILQHPWIVATYGQVFKNNKRPIPHQDGWSARSAWPIEADLPPDDSWKMLNANEEADGVAVLQAKIHKLKTHLGNADQLVIQLWEKVESYRNHNTAVKAQETAQWKELQESILALAQNPELDRAPLPPKSGKERIAILTYLSQVLQVHKCEDSEENPKDSVIEETPAQPDTARSKASRI